MKRMILILLATLPLVIMAERDETLDATSASLKKAYQTVNAAVMFTRLTSDAYPGPFAGPGFVVGFNGPFFNISWFEKNSAEEGG